MKKILSLGVTVFVLAGVVLSGQKADQTQSKPTPPPTLELVTWDALSACGIHSDKTPVSVGDTSYPFAVSMPELWSNEIEQSNIVKLFGGVEKLRQKGMETVAYVRDSGGVTIWDAPEGQFLTDPSGVRHPLKVLNASDGVLVIGFVIFGEDSVRWPLARGTLTPGTVTLARAVLETATNTLHARVGTLIKASVPVSLCGGSLNGSARITERGLELFPGSTFTR
jgi:hypothetical protein